MKLDEKQPRSATEAPAADASSDSTAARGSTPPQGEPGSDDLEALAGALPSVAHASEAPPPDTEEELDLGALAAVGGRRPPAAAAPATAAPGVQAPARAAWVLPLVVGLALGAGVAGVVFVATAGRSAQPSAQPTPTGAPAPASAQAIAQPSPVPTPGTEAVAAADPAAPAVVASPQLTTTADTQQAQPPGAAPAPKAQQLRSRLGAAAAAAPEPALDNGAAAEASAPVLAVTPAEEDQAAAAEAAAKAAAANATNAKGGPPSSMDALLDEALAPAARNQELAFRQQAALQGQELPLTPSREDVTRAMTVLLPAIRGCAMGNSGLATAGIVVGGDGRVVGVEVSGAPFAGTASGRCMEGVIRRARFSRFRQPTFRIKFPLAIQ